MGETVTMTSQKGSYASLGRNAVLLALDDGVPSRLTFSIPASSAHDRGVREPITDTHMLRYSHLVGESIVASSAQLS